jgi:hypothetical protein
MDFGLIINHQISAQRPHILTEVPDFLSLACQMPVNYHRTDTNHFHILTNSLLADHLAHYSVGGPGTIQLQAKSVPYSATTPAWDQANTRHEPQVISMNNGPTMMYS